MESLWKKTLKICSFHLEQFNLLWHNLCPMSGGHDSKHKDSVGWTQSNFHDTFFVVSGFMPYKKNLEARDEMPKHKKIYKRTNSKKGSDIPLFIRSYSLLLRFLFLLGDMVSTGMRNYLKQSIKIVSAMSLLNKTVRVSFMWNGIKFGKNDEKKYGRDRA